MRRAHSLSTVQARRLLTAGKCTRADYLLDEMERALHDSLCAIKRTLESGSVVPGGGAVETALSIYLENFATTLVRSLGLCLASSPR